MPFDEHYFSTHNYADVSFAKFSMYWWSNRFFAILARRYGRRGSRLLEVGSGLGHLIGQLENSFVTYGLDINRWAVARSAAQVKRSFLQAANAQDLPYAGGSFGAVIIKHIIEHLPEPARALEEISRILEPNGILILATPNLEGLLKPLKGEKWHGYTDPTHISLKRPGEWLEMIRGAGLSPLKVFADGFWNVPYVPSLPTPIQKVLFGSFGGLQAITGFVFLPMDWGESVIVIARKNNRAYDLRITDDP